MKFSISTLAFLVAAAQAANIELVSSVQNSAAKAAFEKSKTLVFASSKKRDVPKVFEPAEDRDYTLQDGLVFVLQCQTPGFRPECVSFGSKPGECVSYFDFNGKNSTEISDMFNHNITSLSTNTGGVCQFYQ
ncbi:hypothetical protein F53441_9121 [Fusarium austroafricanum]|uniref:Uncharacterized protein n=1 Tax=Fusarium austroafricanum TaxID=2364996 RepID=A0A8H4KE23_9HYPO|nr:hypothetical protein F53441_9121 [Fusarium austroafricanum]